jgi:hypothetical protein
MHRHVRAGDGGGWVSRETFNASDNPNKGSRIIPWPRRIRSPTEVSQSDPLREQIFEVEPNFRSDVFCVLVQQEPIRHLASVGAASAQTTVITREPVQSRTVVITEPLQLTPVQRQTIYRTIVRERVAPAQPTVKYRVGARIPESVQPYAAPQEVAVEVPAIRAYKYMVVNNRIVWIDPATSEVVAEVVD